MQRESEPSRDDRKRRIESFPGQVTGGETVVVATPGDPTQYAVGLQSLSAFGGSDDVGLVVTTIEGATATLEAHEEVCPESGRPSLRFVDTTASRPSAPALYQGASAVFIPSPGDLERLVVALSEIAGSRAPPAGERHLLARSLTPILEEAPTDRVLSVLDRITGLRTDGGLAVLEIDYTAHDEPTMDRLGELADGVLWVRESPSGDIELEYNPSGERYRGRSTQWTE